MEKCWSSTGIPSIPTRIPAIEKFGNVTQYADGLKIDFTVYPVTWIQNIVQAPALPAELDAGYRLLLDKDNLTHGLKQPTYSAYIPVKPSNEIYQKWIEDFFSDVPYAAKCLWRGELLPLKWCLDYDMKHVYLRQMLEWKIGLDSNWSIPVGCPRQRLEKATAVRALGPNGKMLRRCRCGGKLGGVIPHDGALPPGGDGSWREDWATLILLELDQRVTAYVQKIRHVQEMRGKDGV